MPAKSKAQLGKLFALENRGQLQKGVAEKFAKETPNIKALPEHIRKIGDKAEAMKKAKS